MFSARAYGAVFVDHDVAGEQYGRGGEHGAVAGPVPVGADRPPAAGVSGQRAGHGRPASGRRRRAVLHSPHA